MRTLFALAALAASSTALAVVCAGSDFDLSTTGAAVGTGSTVGATDDWQPTCGLGSAGAGDLTWEFTAPIDGSYTFDTATSNYDTTVSLWSTGDCLTQLACNDDASGLGLQSSLTIDLLAGETVAVVVDGFGGSEGDAVLNVGLAPLPTCTPDVDLGTAVGPAVYVGNTCGAGDDYGAVCGFGGVGEDLLFTWTSATGGDFYITTVGSDHDTVLDIKDPGCVDGACNDDELGFYRRSRVGVAVSPGDSVTFAVHGYNAFCGDVVVNIVDATLPDADGDGIEDAVDVCDGHDFMGDADGDAICDEVDVCFGDNATGDNDDDGVCDSADFSMTQTPIIARNPMTFTAINAMPGARVFFLVSTAVDFNNPTCHPQVTTACTVLRRPTVVGSAIADAFGSASLTLTVPASAAGQLIYSEAAWFMSGLGDTTGYYAEFGQ